MIYYNVYLPETGIHDKHFLEVGLHNNVSKVIVAAVRKSPDAVAAFFAGSDLLASCYTIGNVRIDNLNHIVDS